MGDCVLICCGEFAAFDKAQMVIPVKPQHHDDDNRSGGAIQLSTRGSSSCHRSPLGSEDEIRRRSSSSKSSYVKEAAIDSKKRGMVLPFEPYSINFDEITYSVNMPQLVLLRRGGQEIYVGPLGRHSSHVIQYFEAIEGVNKIKEGYNPATWMLEVTTVAQELTLSVDFAEIYKNSDLYRYI
ncbi:hypothetical protein Dsin_013598 [Dipteronia sinensis]|uniref:Uncharacterized protein n=1 Tax=Dipteronia sinensis TaxID=43782 RepID=A0AAE0AK98_9ROSI|nr:hypothetical protein Dsin_013598 [Dipteronia sinensis]